MTNKDFAVAFTKAFYFFNNYSCVNVTYPTLFDGEVTKCIPEFFKAFRPMDIEHILGKFNDYYEDYGCHAFLYPFFASLDGSNRMRLLKWVNENYECKEDFGLNLKIAE